MARFMASLAPVGRQRRADQRLQAAGEERKADAGDDGDGGKGEVGGREDVERLAQELKRQRGDDRALALPAGRPPRRWALRPRKMVATMTGPERAGLEQVQTTRLEVERAHMAVEIEAGKERDEDDLCGCWGREQTTFPARPRRA